VSTTVDPARLAAVQRKAEEWARELIDLDTRTNTLISFTPGRASVDLSDAAPDRLRGLYAGSRVRLTDLLPDADTAARTKAVRQCRLVRSRAAQLEEEQGVDALRVVTGLLCIQPAGGRTPGQLTLRAPLLLARLTVASTAGGTDFTLELTDEPEPNPVLPLVLERVFGVALDPDEVQRTLDSEVAAGTDHPNRVDRVYAVLARLAGDVGLRATLRPATAIGLFSYEKFPMVQDLRSAPELLAGHDVVAALGGFQPSLTELAGADTSPLPISDAIPPNREYLVLDADSSQQQAISAVLAGRNAVIVGPPGTGKSQTIANIIAGAAAIGRSVLFVAEKRAAIEAVTQRLAQVGLDGLVFDLHQQKIKKREVAAQLAASLERAGRERLPEIGDLHDRLSRSRQQISEQARLLHQRVDPWQLSPYELQERLLRLPPDRTGGLRLRGGALRRLHGDAYRAAVADLRDYMHADGLRVRRRESPWADAQVRDEDDVRHVLAQLDAVQTGTLRDSQHDLHVILRETGLAPPSTFAQWQGLFGLLDSVTQTVAELGARIHGPELEGMIAATAPRGSAERAARALRLGERRRLRKQAQARSRSQLRGGPLHERLLAARAQRDQWRHLSAGQTLPYEITGLGTFLARFHAVRNSLAAVAMCIQINDLEARPTAAVEETLRALAADRRTFTQILSINQANERLERAGLGQLLDQLAGDELAAGRRLAAAEAVQLLETMWLRSLEEEFSLLVRPFGEFVGSRQDAAVAAFEQADRDHLRLNRGRIRRAAAERLRAAQHAHPDESRLVKQEAAKKRGHLPLRALVKRAPHVLLGAHPCWAMSPLVVSRMLPAERLFDMVVFDEASQVEPHDAVTSIMRGRQLVIAGDPRQLPPNRMFRTLVADEDNGEEENENELADYESILNALSPILEPGYLLKWHYRSRDERLIAFANKEIYDNDLVTFAGVGAESPLRLEVVDGTVTPGQSGAAPAEVSRVVELVAEHARTRPDESLGVIAFGSKQSDAIEATIRTSVDQYPEIEKFAAENDVPGRSLFVKNLERVQGDERDAIILSVGRPKTAAGRVALQFGALNTEGGERRLNVAITRAKVRMTVVSSFAAHEMPPNATKNKGPELLRQFLAYAADAQRLGAIGRSREGVELNGFEQSILAALRDRLIDVYPQWGVGEYSIDFALAHPDQPGLMVLAVEADGDRYHRTYATRDRDRLRQAHLEGLGWRFHRVWSTAWFRDPAGETARIVAAWRAAVAAVDEETPPLLVEPEPAEADEPVIDATLTRGHRPCIERRAQITDYPQRELVDLFGWLLSDGLLLEAEERLYQALRELGFQKLGPRIRAALTAALTIAEARMKGPDI